MERGVYTALITPFRSDGSIDYESFQALCRLQLEAGNNLVPCGTTGESPTLSHDEQIDVIGAAVEVAKGYPGLKVMAGIGSNSTAEAIDLAERSLALGADLGLSVDPYYNKPDQAGAFQHHSEIAKVGLPLVVYVIPGRTGGTGTAPATLVDLAQDPNIIGLKAAFGVTTGLTDILRRRPEGFSVLSGDDPMTHYMIAGGGDGVVSVSSNVVPAEVNSYVTDLLGGKSEQGFRKCMDLYPVLIGLMDHGQNPQGVKEAAYIMREQLGIPDYEPNLRLPMTRLAEGKRQSLAGIISDTLS